MSSRVDVVALTHVDPEDQARADMYALLSRLFYGAVDAALLAQIAAAGNIVAQGEDTSFADAWRLLAQSASQSASQSRADDVRLEYEQVFVGAGKAEISLYATAYPSGAAHTATAADKRLVALRSQLNQLGIARRDDAHEPEDHVSALADVMRLLIAGNDRTQPANLAQQAEFFRAYLAPWVRPLAEHIGNSPNTRFYRAAGGFLRAFLELERRALEME